MLGSNELVLCGAEVIRAVEFYLNEKQFKEPVKVSYVHMDSKGLLVITLKEISNDEQNA